eukprot:364209-Chlamydomonas_euryale.AAC.8
MASIGRARRWRRARTTAPGMACRHGWGMMPRHQGTMAPGVAGCSRPTADSLQASYTSAWACHQGTMAPGVAGCSRPTVYRPATLRHGHAMA